MKKWLLLAILLLIPSAMAQTWTSQEEFKCDTCCIENNKLSLTTTIINNGTETLWIGEAKLVSKEGEEFASYKPAGENFKYGLQPRNSIKLEYSGKWPKPSVRNSLHYKQCIRSEIFGKWACEEKYKEKIISRSVDFQCYKDSDCPSDQVCEIAKDCTSSKCEIIPIAMKCGRIVRGDWRSYECCSDYACKEDQYCLEHSCEQVECVACGYIQDHKCVKFECCENSDCSSSQSCVNHECEEITCGYCEYAEEHGCKKHECCKSSECGEEEACVENKCQKITCDGYIEEHECLKYQCEDNEGCEAEMRCENGFCTNLRCEEKDIIKGHECQELGQTPFGYIKENRYVPYFSKEAYEDNKITYILILILIVALITKITIKKIKQIIKEKRRRESYILIGPKKNKQ